MTTVWDVFDECVRAIRSAIPTRRGSDDKEFHFQRWVGDRIALAGYAIPDGRRNSYPDFPLPEHGEAYEVKGITVGSRENDFDSNSALPSGRHGDLDVFYVFGRYESGVPDRDRVTLRDLVIAHGSLLNAGGGYDAANTSMRVVGSYGDVLLRDRKMYVAYTPYSLITGIRDDCSLVLPAGWPGRPDRMTRVGYFERVEHDRVLIGYRADLAAGTLSPEFEENPHAGRRHGFEVWATEERARIVDLA